MRSEDETIDIPPREPAWLPLWVRATPTGNGDEPLRAPPAPSISAFLLAFESVEG